MSQNISLDRREVVASLLKNRKDLLVVSGLGSATYDCAAVDDHPNNFYLWGAMGGTASLAFGLALAQPRRPILALTGDGDMLMGLGALATIGTQGPKNLTIIILDNEEYGETGSQPSATALGTSLSDVARATSTNIVEDITNMNEVNNISKLMHEKAGPLFVNIKIDSGNPKKVLPSRDGHYLSNRFRESVLSYAKNKQGR